HSQWRIWPSSAAGARRGGHGRASPLLKTSVGSPSPVSSQGTLELNPGGARLPASQGMVNWSRRTIQLFQLQSATLPVATGQRLNGTGGMEFQGGERFRP